MEGRAYLVRRAFLLSLPAVSLFVASGCRESGNVLGVDTAARADDDSVRGVSGANGRRVQYGFWMDTSRCVACGACVMVCREAHGLPDETARRRLVRYVFENGDSKTLSVACFHCAEPACARVCPASAISKREGGVVVVDQDRCIGCKYCKQACPFGIPQYGSKGMEKCDCCLSRGVKTGDIPLCVSACKADALSYGNLDDLFESSGGRAVLLQAPTGPSCYLS